MQINKDNLKRFRADFAAAVAALEKEYGLDIQLGNIQYSPTDFRGTLTCTTTEVNGIAFNAEADAFKTVCQIYGFDASDYMKQFKHQGTAYELYGFNTNAPKNCILFRKVGTDKCYHSDKRFADKIIKPQFGKQVTKVTPLPSDIKNRLREIGNDVASGWGAECINYSIDDSKGEVIFNCIEHGEKFVSTMTFKELVEEYGKKTPIVVEGNPVAITGWVVVGRPVGGGAEKKRTIKTKDQASAIRQALASLKYDTKVDYEFVSATAI